MLVLRRARAKKRRCLVWCSSHGGRPRRRPRLIRSSFAHRSLLPTSMSDCDASSRYSAFPRWSSERPGTPPQTLRDAGQRLSRADLGDGFWGQVRGFPGKLRVLQGKGAARRNEPICRESLLASAFPNRIAAAQILHGKEAVPGSSPGEGLNTCKTGLFDDYRVPLEQGGRRGWNRPQAKDSPQITVFSDLTEHLPETEVLDDPATGRSGAKRLEQPDCTSGTPR
jgi:hypothetical protein